MGKILRNIPKKLNHLKNICGIDEVGRGALAGPLVAASVILPKNFKSELVRDSKKMSEKRRERAFLEIMEKALDWSVSFVEPKKVDELNVQIATYRAMNDSLNKLKIKPKHILVDGNVFKNETDIPHTCIIKGDDKYYSIAAASIIAKVTRDNFMKELHKEHPKYGWEKNKGYGSETHRKLIKEDGVTKHHRKTFLKKILSTTSSI